MIGPYPRSYWVEPGRLLAGFYPGDQDEKKAEEKLRLLIDSGVTHFFNLMEPAEGNHQGRPFVPYETAVRRLAHERGITVKCSRYAIVDQQVPTTEDMARILDDLSAALAVGEVVYVHCWGGRGRTATVVGCHLRRSQRLPGPAALARLAELTAHHASFHPAPQMECQREFILAWKEAA